MENRMNTINPVLPPLPEHPAICNGVVWTELEKLAIEVYALSTIALANSKTPEVDRLDLISERLANSKTEAMRQVVGERKCETCEGRGVVYQCVICGADEPGTGTCGSDDSRALCKQLVSTTPAAPIDVAASIPAWVYGWLVENGKNGDELRYRTWEDGMPAWTTDNNVATRYARREDAERAHQEDEDAWRIVEHGWASQSAAAPATPNLIGMEVSIDVSTGDEDGGNRIFGRVDGVQAGTDGKSMILATEESRNFAAPQAQQPEAAPSDLLQLVEHKTKGVPFSTIEKVPKN
jgi:hypothetical protein